MASPMVPGIQSPQLNSSGATQPQTFYPGLSFNRPGSAMNNSRPGSAASPALNGQPGVSPHPPPAQPSPNMQNQQAHAPPSAQKQTPVPVPAFPGQQQQVAHAAVQPPIVSSDVGNPTQSPSPAPTANSASGSVPPSGSKIQLPPDLLKAQKFSEDYTKLCTLITESDPEAVRRAMRDQFEKCMLGSAYHMAFIMNVAMHRAERGILSRAVRDFGAKIVSEGKADLIKWMKATDLDEVSDLILAKASDTFLDKALVMRLPSIEARRLVNALARAERLGYDKNDIVENEHVIPTVAPGAPPANPPPPPASSAPPAAPPAVPIQSVNRDLTPPANIGPIPRSWIYTTATGQRRHGPEDHNRPECTFCRRIFEHMSAWTHHVKKRICTRALARVNASGDILLCPHCGQSFGAHYGLQYHMMNKVCGDFGPVTKEDCQNIRSMPGPPANASYGFNPSTKRPAPDSTPTQYTASSSPAPSQTPAYVMQTPQSQSVPSSQSTPASIQIAGIQKPPLGTPQAKDMAHLTASQVQCLLGDLLRAEEDFKSKIATAKGLGLSEAELEKKMQSFRNSYACKQSTVRKKYGIRLRERRGRAEMVAERDQMGYGTGPRLGTPGASQTNGADKHADKRARVNGAGDAAVTSIEEQTPQPQRTPIKQVAVADIGGGLTGSNATAAMEDPTMSMSQPPQPSQAESSRPSSSYTQGNYRVQVHVPSPSTKKILAGGPKGPPNASSPSKQQSAGMTAQELLRQMSGDVQVIDDSSSSSEAESDFDSDSDSGTDDGNGGRGIKSEPPQV
ncbi:hypothetical protein CkaCkLH20_12773 [Colletotrichum karsti]|uniref:Uncharacterized protein n=1 Tax=Colletotrichum karsti TaxID=1095194 RepID=A0A9P6LEN7_9PEZI|nr:uncharacterized protein CkaCkLH20_12773 [Colletotrichum karsti]KAF9869730.1 hypothetical protein CkaCkLH20_12773 [Colletotrichum karsti]